MDISLLQLLAGASGGALITGILGLISSAIKGREETKRQLRELAVKLTLEQWPVDKIEGEDARTRLISREPLATDLIDRLPKAHITDTYNKVIAVLNNN